MLQWYIRKFKGGITIILDDNLEPVWSCERWPWSSKVDKNLEKTYSHIYLNFKNVLNIILHKKLKTGIFSIKAQ